MLQCIATWKSFPLNGYKYVFTTNNNNDNLTIHCKLFKSFDYLIWYLVYHANYELCKIFNCQECCQECAVGQGRCQPPRGVRDDRTYHMHFLSPDSSVALFLFFRPSYVNQSCYLPTLTPLPACLPVWGCRCVNHPALLTERDRYFNVLITLYWTLCPSLRFSLMLLSQSVTPVPSPPSKQLKNSLSVPLKIDLTVTVATLK